MAYTVAVTWIAKPGEEDEVARCLTELVEPSLAEEGTLVYIPNRDPEDPTKFFIYEQYVDEAAYTASPKPCVLKCSVSVTRSRACSSASASSTRRWSINRPRRTRILSGWRTI